MVPQLGLLLRSGVWHTKSLTASTSVVIHGSITSSATWSGVRTVTQPYSNLLGVNRSTLSPGLTASAMRWGNYVICTGMRRMEPGLRRSLAGHLILLKSPQTCRATAANSTPYQNSVPGQSQSSCLVLHEQYDCTCKRRNRIELVEDLHELDDFPNELRFVLDTADASHRPRRHWRAEHEWVCL